MPSFISVIVPVYNAEAYLRQCVDSILGQTFADFELLLIDDGSSDFSAMICDEYEQNDHRVKTYHLENGGPARARNFGLSKAVGEWVSFVDADDWLEVNMFDFFYRNQENEANLDMLIAGKIVEGGGKQIEKQASVSCVYGHKEIQKAWMKIMEFIPCDYIWNRLYRRSVIVRNHLEFENYTMAEDTIFNIDFHFLANKVKIIKGAFYHYRVNLESVSKGYQKDQEMATVAVFNHYKSFFQPDIEKHEPFISYVWCIKALSGVYSFISNLFRTNNPYSFSEKVKKIEEVRLNQELMDLIRTQKSICRSANFKIECFLILHADSFLIALFYGFKALLKQLISKRRCF